jgi:hypothetical protein
LILEVGCAPFDRLAVFEYLFGSPRLDITTRMHSDDSVPGPHCALEVVGDTGLVGTLEQLPKVLPQLIVDLRGGFHAGLTQLPARSKFHTIGGKAIHHETRAHALRAIVIGKYSGYYGTHTSYARILRAR